MSCFSCFTLYEKRRVHNNKKGGSDPGASPDDQQEAPPMLPRLEKSPRVANEVQIIREPHKNNIDAQTFTFRELAAATKNFKQETLLGEGGFGRVYKGQLGKVGQTIAVKQLDRNGMQGNKEFMVEVLMLSLLHHDNLVNLLGYCADGDQRLLVYEFMPLGSLEDHLFDLEPEDTPLNWFTRLKIALGAAKGLQYLHVTANPPVIYRDLKSSNILLDQDYNAKLSDFGLAKLGPQGDNTHVSSRVMGTYGYCAPEYQRTGHLTLKSDIYSYGVVLLELITGRRAIDPTRPPKEQNLVTWAEPYFRDPSKFPLLADPLLEGDYPMKALNQVVAIAAMCLQNEASVRPLVTDIVTALNFLNQGQQKHAPPPQTSPTTVSLPKTPVSDPQPQPIAILVPPQPAPAPTYDDVEPQQPHAQAPDEPTQAPLLEQHQPAPASINDDVSQTARALASASMKPDQAQPTPTPTSDDVSMPSPAQALAPPPDPPKQTEAPVAEPHQPAPSQTSDDVSRSSQALASAPAPSQTNDDVSRSSQALAPAPALPKPTEAPVSKTHQPAPTYDDVSQPAQALALAPASPKPTEAPVSEPHQSASVRACDVKPQPTHLASNPHQPAALQAPAPASNPHQPAQAPPEPSLVVIPSQKAQPVVPPQPTAAPMHIDSVSYYGDDSDSSEEEYQERATKVKGREEPIKWVSTSRNERQRMIATDAY